MGTESNSVIETYLPITISNGELPSRLTDQSTAHREVECDNKAFQANKKTLHFQEFGLMSLQKLKLK